MNQPIDFKALGEWSSSPEAVDFLFSQKSIKRFAIGRNESTLEVARIVQLDGIIDDFCDIVDWNGIPIVTSTHLDDESYVVNCSTSISPVSVERVFSKKPGHLISLNALITASSGLLSKPKFCTEMWDVVENQSVTLNEIFQKLSDEKSKKTFLDTITYRLYLKPSSMIDYTVQIQNQYFEDFMEYNNEVFLDAGGFDGDTAQEFADRYPDYKEIILIEPSEANISKARVRLSSYDRITYLQNAVSNENKQLNFTPDAGSASAITEAGEFMVDAIKIDTVKTATSISTIKMDLEGWEMQALKGATQTISHGKPKLAIAVYHSSYDYIDIYKYIMELNPNYNIYLRHYTEGWSETIMFFK